MSRLRNPFNVVDTQVVGIVNGRLDPQNRTLLVIHLDRVPIHAVQDPYTFWTLPQVGDHLTVESQIDMRIVPRKRIPWKPFTGTWN